MKGLELTLGFSSCPNDTFMFDALVHRKIDTEGLQFRVVMKDVETLNRMALRNELDVSKVSFAAFARMTDHYQLLNAGSALGNGVGPLVVSKRELKVMDLKAGDLCVAIPGVNTTANFLFSLFFPAIKNKIETIFSEIENSVLSGKADAGVIIHENRFTYSQKGLKKICDLGELWENETGQPIPLGGIVVKRSLPEEEKLKMDRVLKRSVEFAFANPQSSERYVKEHAQEMDAEVRQKHIDTYVNDFSIDLGEKGRKAIHALFEKSVAAGILNSIPTGIFVNSQ